jgi:hypothetical protein
VCRVADLVPRHRGIVQGGMSLGHWVAVAGGTRQRAIPQQVSPRQPAVHLRRGTTAPRPDSKLQPK